MSSSAASIRLAEHYGAANYAPLPIVVARGEGAWVEDPEGHRYLDMLSAYSALSHGHRHPRVMAALTEQASRCTLTSRAFHNDRLGPFLRELCEFTGMDRALPMNTGVEAVETALKLARKWGYERKGVARHEAEIVVCENNFHGRTITAVSMSTEAAYRDVFGPFTPGFRVVPFGDADAVEGALTENTVAVLVEPIQGEGGVVVPPDGYLRQLRELCTRRNTLLMLDEIQTGLGRTGRPFAFEHEGARPDVLILGKALGGGVLPVSAIVSDGGLMELWRPGEHGSTFGGNPLACAVGTEALRVLREEELTARAAELGPWLSNRLCEIDSPVVDHVRGRGLLLGIVLRGSAGIAHRVCEQLLKQGLLCKEARGEVVRLAPPLVTEHADLEWAAERIAQVLGREAG
jgi:ornithine--oxo-acid transaminase